MRSVYFHLAGVTRQLVARRLSTVASPNGPESWSLPRGSSAPVLHLGFCDDLLTEAEPSDLQALTRCLGAAPSVTVVADVSGLVPGKVEVREFSAFILNEFRGVAWDDYTRHCWTLSEIESNAQAEGHTFFDYDGWADDSRNESGA